MAASFTVLVQPHLEKLEGNSKVAETEFFLIPASLSVSTSVPRVVYLLYVQKTTAYCNSSFKKKMSE